jgi:hypothetical protein
MRAVVCDRYSAGLLTAGLRLARPLTGRAVEGGPTLAAPHVGVTCSRPGGGGVSSDMPQADARTEVRRSADAGRPWTAAGRCQLVCLCAGLYVTNGRRQVIGEQLSRCRLT